MKSADLRYLAWGVSLVALAALPLLAGFTTWGWEASELLGLGAALVCVALCGSPVRPREAKPPVLLRLSRHVRLGWAALAAAVLHVAVALAVDDTVIEHLKPTLPRYQLAGLAAITILAILVASSSAGSRRRLWRTPRNFQAGHIVLGCLLLCLLTVHVVTTDRYTGGRGRRLLFIMAAAGGVLFLLRRRYRDAGRDAPGRRLAFGRHSTLIAAVIVATVSVLACLLPSKAGMNSREPLLARTTAIPLYFDHAKHAAVNCLACHHNYADGRGFDACIHCHRSARADLMVGAEARFHDFCLTCHRHPAATLPRHGPVSGCSACHRPSALP